MGSRMAGSAQKDISPGLNQATGRFQLCVCVAPQVSVFLTVFPAVALAAEEQLPWAKLLKPAKEELSAG